MLKRIIFIAIGLGLLTACDQQASDGKSVTITEPKKLSVLDQYQHQADNLLISVRTRRPAATIASESQLLVAQSQALLSEFMLNYPQCSKYLSALNKAVETMKSLSREEIASNYLKGNKLSTFSEPVCYHAKNTLVYPVMIQVIASQGMENIKIYQAVEKDIVAAIAHFEVVQNAINKLPQR